MKKLAILVLFCILAGLVFPAGVQAAPTFSDTKTHWAKDYIVTVASAGYVSGYQDGSFKPDKIVTRAEFTSVLVRCLGYEPSSGTNYFSDMSSHWAKGYVNKAVTLGIITPGDYGDKFGPNTGLKRSEICAMLVRALGEKPDNTPTSFNDNAAINKSMFRGYIKVASDLKLLSGYPNGNFEPFQEVTRAQMCKVIINFTEAQGNSLDLPNTPPTDTATGDFRVLSIGDQEYDLATTPVIFKVDLNNLPATSLTQQQGYLFINGQYRFALNSPMSKLDIMVNDTRYEINQFSTSSNRLIIYPGKRKIGNVTMSGHKYDSDFINLYINSNSKGYYLSDLSIIDNSTVEVANIKYHLPQDKISIELGSSYYDIIGLNLSSTSTTPTLTKTDPVVARGYKLTDISAIFVGTTTLNLSGIVNVQFLVDGKIYSLPEIQIDASGNFLCDNQSYPASKVLMIIDSTQYSVNHATLMNGKLIFYCTKDSSSNLLMLDNKYRDATGVIISKDGINYNLNQVMIVSKNILRIGNKQYALDSTIKVLFDGSTYNISEINFDNALQIPIIVTSGKVATNTQPVTYNFYLNNNLLQSGAGTDTSIYTSSKWISFALITITDPSYYTYSGTSYNLIGALVQIGKKEYKVYDTAWRGASKTIDIYLTQ